MSYKGGIDSFTKLLIQSDTTDGSTTFEDEIGTHTITANNDVQHDTAQMKFGASSILFDGTGDHLTIPDHSDFDFGTGDFTIDFFIRFNSVASDAEITEKGNDNGADWALEWLTSNNLRLQLESSVVKTESWTPSTGTWYHVAITRKGTDLRMFVDGSELGSATTNSSNITGTDDVYFGTAGNGSSRPVNGWMDQIRISKGIARWIDDFTPPDQAYAEYDHNLDSNDVLMLNFEGDDEDTSTTDESDSAHAITFVGDAEIDTGIKKFGSSSLILDNSGDYLTVPIDNDWDLGTGDFTIDLWAYSTTQSLQTPFGMENSAFMVIWNGATNMSFYLNSSTARSWVTDSKSNSVWYHLVFVRFGDDLFHFMDGVHQGTNSVSGWDIQTTQALQIGRWSPWGTFGGNIDGLRITKGVARFTESFAVPTEAYSEGGSPVVRALHHYKTRRNR